MDSPRILVVRLSAIGDTVHSLPLAAALRRARPDAYIGWVVEKPSAALVENNPALDWWKVLPKGWLKKPAQVVQLWYALQKQRFTVAFDIQGLTKSAMVARLSGARTRIGFTRGEGREIAPSLDNVLLEPRGRHAVDMTLSLLRGIGMDDTPRPVAFPLPDATERDRRAIHDAIGNRPFVMMGPWGSFASKLWPLERFCELAKRIRDDTGLISYMLGHGEAERSRVGELAASSDNALLPAPDVSLTGVAEMARRARLFVGCDSFPMHAAAAVGCRTLGLFGITDPERLGPYGPHGRAVFERITLVKSTRERRRLGPENMLALEVDRVFAACREMLTEALT